MIKDTNGSTNGTSIAFSVAMTESAFMTIAFYHVIELHCLLFNTFKKWRGLYFWSVFGATWGVALNGLGVVLKSFNLTDGSTAQMIPVLLLLLVGWYLMVTGQSVALYSRLHLVVYDRRIVRGVLYLIIFLAVTCHLPLTIIIFILNTTTQSQTALKVYKVYEPLQLTLFSIQEAIISILYMVFAFQVLRPIEEVRGPKIKTILRQLIVINVLVIILDITLIALQFAGYDEVQHFYKAAVYSIKLKLEFTILNQLLKITKDSNSDHSTYRYPSSKGIGSLDHWGKQDANSDRDQNVGSTQFSEGRDISLVHLERADIPTKPIVVRSQKPLPNPQHAGVKSTVEHSERPVQDNVGRVDPKTGRVSSSSSQIELVETRV
ncbi:hypothetical protein BGZ63DRAFT_464859 [Mariannaea sp. PMI_226]|nr:hypothetical protein BGZ63DRAFT_464859 [Mariannaea sp. PMI_226]